MCSSVDGRGIWTMMAVVMAAVMVYEYKQYDWHDMTNLTSQETEFRHIRGWALLLLLIMTMDKSTMMIMMILMMIHFNSVQIRHKSLCTVTIW